VAREWRVVETLVVPGLAEKTTQRFVGGQKHNPVSFPKDQITPPCRPTTMIEVEDHV
jgi:hypothetical protein